MNRPILTLKRSVPVASAEAAIGMYGITRKVRDMRSMRFTQLHATLESAQTEARRLYVDPAQPGGLYFIVHIVDAFGAEG